MGVYIGVDDYSAIQGPCPDGFHIPLNTEWTAVKTVWTSLGGGGSAGTNFCNTLKLPFAGRRIGQNATTADVGTGGYYWNSNAYSGTAGYHIRI